MGQDTGTGKGIFQRGSEQGWMRRVTLLGEEKGAAGDDHSDLSEKIIVMRGILFERVHPKRVNPGRATLRKISRPVSSSGCTSLMKSEFAAIVEPAPKGGCWAICPENPGANGQGETLEETRQRLIEAVEVLLDDRR